jgi:hypothetical protein
MVNLYNDLGFNGGLVLTLGALYVTVATMANFLASFVMDFVGRVRLLSTFCFTFTSCFLTPWYSHRDDWMHDHPRPRMRYGGRIHGHL